MAAEDTGGALTKHVGPLPIWGWGGLVLAAALAYSYIAKGKSGKQIDPQTGLPMGSPADAQALSSLQQIQSAANRGGSGGGSQTPPTIIQDYPASTTTISAPVWGSRFGFNGSPSWPESRPPHARKGGPGPQGPGHKPWEHGDRGWNGGEEHAGDGGPGAGDHGDRGDHQGDQGGHGGGSDNPGGRPGWGGGGDQGGHGGGGGDQGGHGGGGGDQGGHGRGGGR